MSRDRPIPGEAMELEPGLRRILAPNPSPMTYWGTNTYLLGNHRITVVDPGPDDPAHLDAMLAALKGATVERILITHAHRDHSTGAPALAAETGAPVLAFGAPTDGRSAVMAALAETGAVSGGEGVDASFSPDAVLCEGARLDCDGQDIIAVHTPGHFAGHLCFAYRDVVFSGDQVMGWASTLISPPDGDLGRFMHSCARLRTLDARILYPGHGLPVDAPSERIDWLVHHRQERDAQIRAALAKQSATPAALTAHLYHDVDPALHPAAMRNVLAHLIDLVERGAAICDGPIAPDATFRSAEPD